MPRCQQFLYFATAITVATVLTGCTPAPKTIAATPANYGVQLVPRAILAAQKSPPTTMPATEEQTNLVQVIARSDQPHAELLRALRLSGMVPLLQSHGPFTFFAPTDFALSKLPPGMLEDLEKTANLPRLRALLRYYLIPGKISLATLLQTNGDVKTLSGQTITIRGYDNAVVVNDATVLRTNNSAYNGVVHWIDAPLLPPYLPAAMIDTAPQTKAQLTAQTAAQKISPATNQPVAQSAAAPLAPSLPACHQ